MSCKRLDFKTREHLVKILHQNLGGIKITVLEEFELLNISSAMLDWQNTCIKLHLPKNDYQKFSRLAGSGLCGWV